MVMSALDESLLAVRANAESQAPPEARTWRNAQQEQADIQEERIDLATRQLAEVSERLEPAANALRQSI